jgi:hypothetical protein
MSSLRPRHALSRAMDMIPALCAAANVRRFMVFSTDGGGGPFIPETYCRSVADQFDDPRSAYAMAAPSAIQGPVARRATRAFLDPPQGRIDSPHQGATRAKPGTNSPVDHVGVPDANRRPRPPWRSKPPLYV